MACINKFGIVWIALTVFCIQPVEAQGGDPCRDRWWQRDVPAAAADRIVNSAYSDAKTELEQECDSYHDAVRALRHFVSLGQGSPRLMQVVNRKSNKIRCLDHRLSLIPMYVAPGEGPVLPPAAREIDCDRMQSP